MYIYIYIYLLYLFIYLFIYFIQHLCKSNQAKFQTIDRVSVPFSMSLERVDSWTEIYGGWFC